jgi:hypothetical protein
MMTMPANETILRMASLRMASLRGMKIALAFAQDPAAPT